MFSPFSGTYKTNVDDFTWQLQIGSRTWPERPCRGVAEIWLRLRQATGSSYGNSGHFILTSDYATQRSILGCNLENKNADSAASIQDIQQRLDRSFNS